MESKNYASAFSKQLLLFDRSGSLDKKPLKPQKELKLSLSSSVPVNSVNYFSKSSEKTGRLALRPLSVNGATTPTCVGKKRNPNHSERFSIGASPNPYKRMKREGPKINKEHSLCKFLLKKNTENLLSANDNTFLSTPGNTSTKPIYKTPNSALHKSFFKGENLLSDAFNRSKNVDLFRITPRSKILSLKKNSRIENVHSRQVNRSIELKSSLRNSSPYFKGTRKGSKADKPADCFILSKKVEKGYTNDTFTSKQNENNAFLPPARGKLEDLCLENIKQIQESEPGVKSLIFSNSVQEMTLISVPNTEISVAPQFFVKAEIALNRDEEDPTVRVSIKKENCGRTTTVSSSILTNNDEALYNFAQMKEPLTQELELGFVEEAFGEGSQKSAAASSPNSTFRSSCQMIKSEEQNSQALRTYESSSDVSFFHESEDETTSLYYSACAADFTCNTSILQNLPAEETIWEAFIQDGFSSTPEMNKTVRRLSSSRFNEGSCEQLKPQVAADSTEDCSADRTLTEDSAPRKTEEVLSKVSPKVLQLEQEAQANDGNLDHLESSKLLSGSGENSQRCKNPGSFQLCSSSVLGTPVGNSTRMSISYVQSETLSSETSILGSVKEAFKSYFPSFLRNLEVSSFGLTLISRRSKKSPEKFSPKISPLQKNRFSSFSGKSEVIWKQETQQILTFLAEVSTSSWPERRRPIHLMNVAGSLDTYESGAEFMGEMTKTSTLSHEDQSTSSQFSRESIPPWPKRRRPIRENRKRIKTYLFDSTSDIFSSDSMCCDFSSHNESTAP